MGVAVGLAVTALLAGTSATAEPADGPEVVASGLNNPRHLSFSTKGDLYVAEAGLGGGPGAPSVEGAEGQMFFGLTGSITRVDAAGQVRVVEGLPSLAAEDGSSAIGPTDVDVLGPQRYAATIGLGNDPAVRQTLGGAAARLATVMTGTFASGPRVTADLGTFEASANPDGDLPDTNPGGFLRTPGGYVVVDAGGNSLLAVSASGDVSTIATFAESGGVDAVPTSVTAGSDGAYYVSELTGFPFTRDTAVIWRVVPGQAPEVFAEGLTNVTDLAWHGGDLYAVQLADGGLLAGPPGSLVRVSESGDHETVAGGLLFPYGVAFRGEDAYVTTGAVLPGGGQVVRIPLG